MTEEYTLATSKHSGDDLVLLHVVIVVGSCNTRFIVKKRSFLRRPRVTPR